MGWSCLPKLAMTIAMKSNVLFPLSLANQEKDVPSELESFILILESSAQFMDASAKMIAAFAGAVERYVGSSLAGKTTKSDVRKGMTLLSHTNWMGELNILLALLATKYNSVVIRLIQHDEQKGRFERWDSTVNQLRISAWKWGTALMKLLNLLHSRLQQETCTDATKGQYCLLTVLRLKQFTEMIIIVNRTGNFAFDLNGVAGAYSSDQESLAKELKKLELTWISSTFCDTEQRNKVVLHIRQLQRWMSGAQHQNVQEQTTAPKPWLNNGNSVKKQTKSRKRTNS